MGRHANLKQSVYSNEISIRSRRNSCQSRVICKAHVISHYITARCTRRFVLIPHLYHLHHFQLFREARRVAWDKSERIAKHPNYQPTPISTDARESAFFYCWHAARVYNGTPSSLTPNFRRTFNNVRLSRLIAARTNDLRNEVLLNQTLQRPSVNYHSRMH